MVEKTEKPDLSADFVDEIDAETLVKMFERCQAALVKLGVSPDKAEAYASKQISKRLEEANSDLSENAREEKERQEEVEALSTKVKMLAAVTSDPNETLILNPTTAELTSDAYAFR